jgi:hypothetical protein
MAHFTWTGYTCYDDDDDDDDDDEVKIILTYVLRM